MTNAWFLGATESVPQDENTVRDTRDPLRQDGGESSELSHAPDYNEFTSDESGQLTGLTDRNVSGHTVDSVQQAPFYAALASTPHNIEIDKQVSSSGTAAAREQAGAYGHGTMEYTESIEPQIREGAVFGREFFQSNEAAIQDGMGEYMSPIDNDGWNNAVAQRAATENARRAAQSSLYSAFLGN